MGTDPYDEDTDGDGVSDLAEVVAGTDPLDPDSNPAAEGNFYFLVPYEETPDPTMDTLVFATDIQMADVFFTVDTTGSMGGEITNLKSSLSTYIIPQIQAIIPNVWFGVGRFDDYPYSPFGDSASGDVVFQLNQAMTSSTASAQTAVNSLSTHYGNDWSESDVPALYAIATGSGFGGYLAAQTGCPAGHIGYPCFRPGAVPIIVLITDAPFHNGPGGYDAYYSITPVPPTYAQAVAALNAIHAKVLTINTSGTTSSSAPEYQHCVQISTDTGAVSDTGPLTIAGSTSGTGLGDNVVNAVETLANGVPMDISVVARDDTSDAVDATIFIDNIVPNTVGGVEDPMNPLVICVGGLATANTDADPQPDMFVDVLPGTPVCFDIYPKMNTTVEETGEPQLFHAFVDVIGDSITVLDTRDVYFLVPPSEPIIE
ncbi:MAG: thrombospondin type 3 repeat-containing protein [Proteobacteria bacterium]|nr:thrombospondin type 3 repeat-containing protein [Pseudomonadota bacterium]